MLWLVSSIPHSASDMLWLVSSIPRSPSDMLWLVCIIPHSASNMPAWFPIPHGQCATQAAAQRGKSPWGDHSDSVEKLSELRCSQRYLAKVNQQSKCVFSRAWRADLWPWPPICTSYSCWMFVNVKWCSMAVPGEKWMQSHVYSPQVVLAK